MSVPNRFYNITQGAIRIEGSVEGDTLIAVTNPITGDVLHVPTAVTATAPPADTQVWMPLTTVVGGEPVLVWDGNDQLIPTLTPI